MIIIHVIGVGIGMIIVINVYAIMNVMFVQMDLDKLMKIVIILRNHILFQEEFMYHSLWV